MNELISCITPTFNRAELLKEAIASTIKQTYSNWELIIIDDNSADHTEDVVRKYQETDPRIKYFKNPKKGVSSARNHGIKMAQGEFITFLDDDDIHLPHRFESQLAAMKKSGSRFIVSGCQFRNRKTGKVLEERNVEMKVMGVGFPSRWMVKKELIELVGGYEEDFQGMEDVRLSYKLADHEVYALHDDVISILYDTPNSLSRVKLTRIRERGLLLEKNQNKMPPIEEAWWQFVLGLEYYSVGEKKKATERFKKAAELDSRGVYGLGFKYYQMTKFLGGPFKRVSLKLLQILLGYKFPIVVQHPIISSNGISVIANGNGYKKSKSVF
ncbi:MAG: glycosyltransferase family 2 protein [Saprospiraceae bacterium]|nr:glycosyltransferase family 2 protein [Saprospiraceae bacterium]